MIYLTITRIFLLKVGIRRLNTGLMATWNYFESTISDTIRLKRRYTNLRTTADNCSVRSRERVLLIEKSNLLRPPLLSKNIDFHGILMNRSVRYSSQM